MQESSYHIPSASDYDPTRNPFSDSEQKPLIKTGSVKTKLSSMKSKKTSSTMKKILPSNIANFVKRKDKLKEMNYRNTSEIDQDFYDSEREAVRQMMMADGQYIEDNESKSKSLKSKGITAQSSKFTFISKNTQNSEQRKNFLKKGNGVLAFKKEKPKRNKHHWGTPSKQNSQVGESVHDASPLNQNTSGPKLKVFGTHNNQEDSQLDKKNRRTTIFRDHSEYTRSSNEKSDSMIINSDDSEFEKYFGFKLGEKVDPDSHFARNQPKHQPLEKKQKKNKNMTYEERIANRKHKNDKIKAPTLSNEPSKGILKKPSPERDRLEEKRYAPRDFKELGNMKKYHNNDHSKGTSEKLSDSGYLELPQFYNSTAKIPNSVIKPIKDHRNQSKSRNKAMLAENRTYDKKIHNKKAYKGDQLVQQYKTLDPPDSAKNKLKKIIKLSTQSEKERYNLFPYPIDWDNNSNEGVELHDPTLTFDLKPLRRNHDMQKNILHEQLLYEKKYYEGELRKQFGLEENISVKKLIAHLRNYYNWFYKEERYKLTMNSHNTHKAMLYELLLNNVYSNFLYNRNLVNDPIMEQVHEVKLIEDEKEKRQKQLDLIEKMYPDDAEVDLVKMDIKNLQKKNSGENKPLVEGINLSTFHVPNKGKKDYFKMLDDFKQKRSMKYYQNPSNVMQQASKKLIKMKQKKPTAAQPQIEYDDFYWEKPIFKKKHDGAIMLGMEDSEYEISNTKERTKESFKVINYKDPDLKPGILQRKATNATNYSEKSSKITIGDNFYQQKKDENNQMPHLNKLLDMMKPVEAPKIDPKEKIQISDPFHLSPSNNGKHVRDFSFKDKQKEELKDEPKKKLEEDKPDSSEKTIPKVPSNNEPVVVSPSTQGFKFEFNYESPTKKSATMQSSANKASDKNMIKLISQNQAEIAIKDTKTLKTKKEPAPTNDIPELVLSPSRSIKRPASALKSEPLKSNLPPKPQK
ncbi:unnamed protein product [Moneuplotes crassus]|uniref:Uncharacterized protein n=1 Tax=Euplotes crassus TaxID=5936 RepID=A0AAD1U9S7_EUPCR|nr:unnamed protein product [Moneuplotes crassus]